MLSSDETRDSMLLYCRRDQQQDEDVDSSLEHVGKPDIVLADMMVAAPAVCKDTPMAIRNSAFVSAAAVASSQVPTKRTYH